LQIEEVRRIEAEHALWRAGSLRHLLDDHQLRIYDPIRDWQKRRVDELRDGLASGIHRVFVVKAGRQVGKTHGTNTLKVETGLNQDGTCLVATSTEVALKELVIPVINSIIASAPEDLRPRFIAHRWGMRAGFYFPSTEFVMKLVGVDEDPDGLRGPGLKGGALFTEAGFIKKLAYAYNSIVQPQFSRYPEADAIFESSAAKDVAHPFKRVFEPDAIKRKAFVFMTIDDNKTLSEEVKREMVESARAINPEDAAREYYCVEARDSKTTVFPEFDSQRMLLTAAKPRPKHALCMTTIDPGQRHLFGILWSYLDAHTGKVTFQDSVTLRNPNTERVAAVIAAHELDLWGTQPDTQLASIPLDDTYDANGVLRARGWRTLLEGDRCEDRAQELWELAQNAGRPRSTFQWFDNTKMRFRPNPYLRVSDVSLQLINDLSSLYGLHCQPTKKDSLRSMTGTCRGFLVRGDVDFEPLATEAAAHVEACTWNEKRDKFAEHEIFGHYDLAACFVYSLLMWRYDANVWPEPPEKLFNAGSGFAPDIDNEMRPWNYDDF
jgi:hypothetical protein